jgi:hypothetical protein
MKVTIRKKPSVKNRTRFVLDYYPALIDPANGKKKRFENLGLYLFNNPQTPTERQHNKETEQLAENIRARKQLDLQSELHGFTPITGGWPASLSIFGGWLTGSAA